MKDIKFLDFDSKIFGRKIFSFKKNRLSQGRIPGIKKFCKKNSIECIYFNINPGDFDSLNAAMKNNFTFSGIKTVYKRNLDNRGAKYIKPDDFTVSAHFRESDISDIQELGRQLSKWSRFSFDHNFPAGSSRKLYRIWVKDSLERKAPSGVFILRKRISAEIAGFVSYKIDKKIAQIDLLIITRKYRGRGLGNYLLSHLFRKLKGKGIKQVKVASYINNLSAQKFYQRNGFVLNSAYVTFHLWPKALKRS